MSPRVILALALALSACGPVRPSDPDDYPEGSRWSPSETACVADADCDADDHGEPGRCLVERCNYKESSR